MRKGRVFVTGPAIRDEAVARMRQRGCVCRFGTGMETASDLAEKPADFRPDALIVRKGIVTREVLDLSYHMIRLFAQLAHRERMLLWLAYVGGFTHREIAAQTALRKRSVKVLLYRAHKKLITLLSP